MILLTCVPFTHRVRWHLAALEVGLEWVRQTAAIFSAKADQGIGPGHKRREARLAEAIAVPALEECTKEA